MKKIVWILFILLVFLGCSRSSLQLHKSEKLILDYNKKEFLLTNKIEKQKSLNYKDLFIEQYKLSDKSGRVLFYEDVRTALDYELNFGGLYTIMYVFDNSKKYTEVYRRNNLRLVQLELKNSKYLNLLIQASDTQIYSYVYGFSNEEFMSIANSVKLKDDEILGELKHKSVVFTNSSKPLSDWNDMMVYFTPLITPFREFGYR